MKKNYFFAPSIFLFFLFEGCHPRMYHTTPVNAPVFANKGEVQVNASMGTSGGTFYGGAALTDHLAVAGMLNGSIKGFNYQAHEEEGALGYYHQRDGSAGFCSAVYLGAGGGNNFYLDSGAVVPDYRGEFSRYFVAVSGGTTTGSASTKIKGGGMYAFRFTYMTYAGDKSGYPFWGSNFYFEPYFGGTLGGKYFRFEFGGGAAVKLDFKFANHPGSNITMLPLHMNIGVQFILGRHYE